MTKRTDFRNEPVQLELPCVTEHEAEQDYYWDRHFRHMSAYEKKNENVYIYDLDYTTFVRPKLFTHRPRFNWSLFKFEWSYDLAWYIFWDSFLVSLFDKPLPLAEQMKREIKEGLNVGIFSARSEKWFSGLWVRLKIGKVKFVKFRPTSDNTPDHVLKERYLRECLDEYSFFQWSPRIMAWDDKQEIISMYKQNDVEGYLVK